jgi:type I restriction enzyme R subunit
MNTSGKRALYDNLGKDATVALAVDGAIQASRQDDWRGNPFKIKKIRNAIKPLLKDDEATTDRILELVRNQHEY